MSRTAEADDATHLVCRVGDHRFALPAARVRQVHQAVAVAPLPGAPDAVIGVVNVHGDPVPVLDLRRRLGLGVRTITPDAALVHLDVRGLEMLVLVEAALSVTEIPADVVRRADEVLPGVRHLRGVTATAAAAALVVHDVDTFLGGGEALDVAAALARLDQQAPEPAE